MKLPSLQSIYSDIWAVWDVFTHVSCMYVFVMGQVQQCCVTVGDGMANDVLLVVTVVVKTFYDSC